MKKREIRLEQFAAMAVILLAAMTGVCRADMMRNVGPGFGLMVVLYLVIAVTVICVLLSAVPVVLCGLILLVWRLTHPRAARGHKFEEHMEILLSLFVGALGSFVFVGVILYIKALRKAAQIFFDDVRSNDGKKSKAGMTVCIGIGIILSIGARYIVIKEAYLSRHVEDYLFQSLSPYVFCVLGGIWLITLICLCIRDGKRNKKPADTLTEGLAVFGLLFLGYWWWNYVGILFIFSAIRLGISLINGGMPVHYRIKGEKRVLCLTEETQETTDALHKMAALEGQIKKESDMYHE